MPGVGDKAPDFALFDSDRKPRKLSDFLQEGHKTVLAFFPGAFTGVCTKEACELRDNLSAIQGKNGMLVGISVDSPFAQKGFADVNHLTYPFLSDFSREVIEKYGVVWRGLGGVEGYVSANRAVFVLDSNGTIRFKWVGENPGSYPPVQEILAALS